MFRKRRISQISTIGQLLRTRHFLSGLTCPDKQELDSCWGPDNFEVSWDARDGHENLAEASGTEKRFAGAPLPRSLKVQSWEIGNANTPRSQKVQSWPTGNANRQPPYWWCLVCRTASRGASSLGCLRTSRWSKFVVEMWIFKIDLKFRFEFFCCGMQSCAHHFSHTDCIFSLFHKFRNLFCALFCMLFFEVDFWTRFFTVFLTIVHRFFDHRFFGLISYVKIRFFSRSRSAPPGTNLEGDGVTAAGLGQRLE